MLSLVCGELWNSKKSDRKASCQHNALVILHVEDDVATRVVVTWNLVVREGGRRLNMTTPWGGGLRIARRNFKISILKLVSE